MVLGLNPFCGVHLDGITLTVNDPNANPDQLNYELIAPSGNRYPYIPGQLEDLKLALAYVNEPLNGKWQCRYVSGPCNGDGDNPCGLTQFMFDLRIPPGLATGPRQFNNEFLLQRMVVGGAQEMADEPVIEDIMTTTLNVLNDGTPVVHKEHGFRSRRSASRS